MDKSVFCYAPWSNIEILPNGSILPCCKFQTRHYQKAFNIVTDSIDSYVNSDLLTQVKQDFVQGRWPAGCERCQIEESSNIPSKRQLDFTRWQKHYANYDIDTDDLLTISLALGNTCNLKCIMCGPAASSTWAKEYRDVYDIEVPSITHFRKNNLDTVLGMSQNIVHIDIHGGEPFLANRQDHEKLLDHFIDSKRAGEISLHYTTNGTVWPGEIWQAKWRYFREVDLQISIDGVANRFEYIRYPASWDTLQQNISRYLEYQYREKNFRISLAHTVSAYNILYLDEFFAWCSSTGLPTPWTGKLHTPNHLRPGVWTEQAKQMIVDHLVTSTIPDVVAWADHMQLSNDSEHFADFVSYTMLHDRYRGVNFRKTFPELAGFL